MSVGEWHEMKNTLMTSVQRMCFKIRERLGTGYANLFAKLEGLMDKNVHYIVFTCS